MPPDATPLAEERVAADVPAPMIAVRGLSKTYRSVASGDMVALSQVSFSIMPSEFVSVIGPSGCGKTTILRILAGLVGEYQGEIRVRGNVQHGPTRDVGVAFQDANLLPWRSVLQNILLPAQVLGLDMAASTRRARDLVALVGLQGFEDKLPHELSGGMRQRVSIARALIHDPSILLLDEPFGALDAMTRDNMNLELLRICRRTQKTVFLITHSIAEAVFLSDRVLVMSGRPGRILADMPIELPGAKTLEATGTPVFSEYVLRIRRLLDAGQAPAGVEG